MYIELQSVKNRIHFTFNEAVHVIDNFNISDFSVSANIKTYANIDSYEFKEENQDLPNLKDGRIIAEKHITFERSLLEAFTVPDTITEPFGIMKYQTYKYLVSEHSDFQNGIIKGI